MAASSMNTPRGRARLLPSRGRTGAALRLGGSLALPVFLLIVAAGCSKSTAEWTEQARADDPAQRMRAIHALQARESEADVVVPVLIEALGDKNTYVRRDAARALGTFGPAAKDAVKPLTARLKDSEPSVRKAAAQSLKLIEAAK